MFFTTAVLATASLLAPLAVSAKSLKVAQATPFQAATPLEVSSNVLTLTKKKSAGGVNVRSAAYMLNKIPKSHHTATLLSLFEGQEFATEIAFGKEKLEVIVDTGSSDTWLVESGFACVNITTSAPVDQATCGFGPTYNVTKTFKQIPGENFNITYGDGEFLTGIIGTEQVTLAGLKVSQTVAVVDFAAWNGDGVTSGLVGLAYPSLTSAYNGTDPKLDNTAVGEQIPYDPIFTTLYKSGAIPPVFSLAILRNVSGNSGYLSLGGVPPIPFVQNFTSTPILVTSITGYPKAVDFYTINIDNIILNNAPVPSSGGSKIQYIVDSGTTLNYLPTSVSSAVNAAFHPPAVLDPSQGVYNVACNATAPKFAVRINGVDLHTNPLDMILEAGTDANGNELCISGIVDGGADPVADIYILGDVFQKNVVTVFDVGAAELRFAEREFYPSNDPVKI